MEVLRTVAEPKWKLGKEIAVESLMTEDFLFIGCISYEERCNEAVKLVLGSTSNVVSAVALLEIDDDECTYPSWKEDCQRKTLKHRNEIEEFINENEVRAPSKPLKYAMSRRSQDIVRMKSDIEQTVLELFPSSPGVKCLVDITCMPSYFYFQLVKHLAEKNSLNEIIVLYTKPRDYPKNEPLKVSPFDRTKPDFLPAFGTPSGIEELLEKHKKVTWIVGVGFDYDSVKNAERIRDVMKIEKTNLIIPFPAYRPEYVVRTMKENQKLLKNDESFFYAPADNPFRTFQLIEELMGKGRDFVLSTFGPKPMGLGFCLAAIKNELPIIHVQATNYNPDFSSGSSDIFVFWLKHNGTVCYEYC